MMQETSPKFDPSKIWESQSLDHDRPLSSCAFSPCGKYVVAGSQHEDVQRWELATGTRTPLVAHRSWVMTLAFHPDSKRLLTGDYHGVVHCWNYADATPKPLWTIQDTKHGWVRDVAVSPDGQHLVTTGNDHVVRLWSTDGGKPVREFTGHEHHVFSLAIATDSKTFYSGDLLGKIHQWDISTGKLLRALDASSLHTREEDFLADIGGVRRLAISDDGKLLACSGMTEANGNTFCVGKAAVLVFDLASGKLLQTLRPKTKMDGPLEGLCFLPDGSVAAQGQLLHSTTSIEFWKPSEAEPYHVLKAPTGYSLHMHPDKLRLASACYQANGRTGNGRHADRKEYVSNNGALKIYSLFEKPAEEKKA
jgi:WD40 repeat protein